MLELALLSSVITLVALTALLLGAGRRRLAGGRWRAIATIGVIIAAGLGTLVARSPVPLGVGTAIALISAVEPRRWYAIGALFFASLVQQATTGNRVQADRGIAPTAAIRRTPPFGRR
jgi:hypothetical protein